MIEAALASATGLLDPGPSLERGTASKLVITSSAGAALTALSLSAETATSGTADNIYVSAENQYGIFVPSLVGSVSVASSDKTATMPTAATYTSGTSLDNGIHEFAVTLALVKKTKTTVTFSDKTDKLASATASITVSPGAASKLIVTTSPTHAIAGATVKATVKAEDAAGNLVATDDSSVVISGSIAAADTNTADLINGVGIYSTSFTASGAEVLTATVGTSSVTGTASVTVTSGTVSKLIIAGPSATGPDYGVTELASANFTVTAENSNGIAVPTFSGTVAITTTNGPPATLPDGVPTTVTFVSGVATVAITVNVLTSDTITATDTTTHSVTAGTLAVTAATPS